MARAGWCDACGRNVWLTPDGRCENGHGPESLTGAYEVTDAASQSPIPPPGSSRKLRFVPVAAIVAAVLLACACGCATVFLFANRENRPTARSAVEIAADFKMSRWTGDAARLRKRLPGKGASVTNGEWTEFASAARAGHRLEFGKKTWAGEKMSVVGRDPYEGEPKLVDAEATYEFAADPNDTRIVNVRFSTAGAVERSTVRLEREGDIWTVAEVKSDAGTVDLTGPEGVRYLFVLGEPARNAEPVPGTRAGNVDGVEVVMDEFGVEPRLTDEYCSFTAGRRTLDVRATDTIVVRRQMEGTGASVTTSVRLTGPGGAGRESQGLTLPEGSGSVLSPFGPEAGWAPGRWEAQILVNGKAAVSLEYRVVP